MRNRYIYILLFSVITIEINAQYAGTNQSGNWDDCDTWLASTYLNLVGTGAYINNNHDVTIPFITVGSKELNFNSNNSSVIFSGTNAVWDSEQTSSGVSNCVYIGESTALITTSDVPANGQVFCVRNSDCGGGYGANCGLYLGGGSGAHVIKTDIRNPALSYVVGAAGTYTVTVGTYMDVINDANVPAGATLETPSCWEKDFSMYVKSYYQQPSESQKQDWEYWDYYYVENAEPHADGSHNITGTKQQRFKGSPQCTSSFYKSIDEFFMFGWEQTSSPQYLQKSTRITTKLQLSRFSNENCYPNFYLRHYMTVKRVS